MKYAIVAALTAAILSPSLANALPSRDITIDGPIRTLRGEITTTHTNRSARTTGFYPEHASLEPQTFTSRNDGYVVPGEGASTTPGSK